MAFIDDSDLKPAQPEPTVIIQQAPRSKLVPALLISLNVGLVVVVALFLLKDVEIKWPAGGDEPQNDGTVSVDDLDPASLVTPSGRRLDVENFGGFLFEVTRIVYSESPRARSVTITVPGQPPQMGVFHINESFADGQIRVVEINRSSVILAAHGDQQVFAVDGASPEEVWDKAPSGKSYIPPSRTDIIPDIPDGQVRAPKDPRTEDPEEQPVSDGGSKILEGGDGKTIDDLELEDVRVKPIKREEYNELKRLLPDILQQDFVFATALERDTRMPWGLEIKNLKATSPFFSYGLEVGDVILDLNGHETLRWSDIDSIARRINLFGSEIALTVDRYGEIITFVFEPGLPN